MSDARLKAFCEGLEMQDIPKLMTGTVGDFRRVGEVMKEMIVEKCRRVEALEAEKDELYRKLEKVREERNAARVKYEQPLLARVAELREKLLEYHDNAHFDEEGQLYIGCCITEDEYQCCAGLLSRTPAQSRAEIEAGALERWGKEAREEYCAPEHQGGWLLAIEDTEQEAARIRAGGEG